MIEKILELMGFSRNTYFNWKKENRPIIKLLKKYFSEEDIKEFVETGQITKFDSLSLQNKITQRKFNELFKTVDSTLDFEGVYLLLKFLTTYKKELLDNINNYNVLLNMNKVERYNVFLLHKLQEFSQDTEIKEYNLSENYAEFSIYLIELQYDVKLFLYQAFNTDFQYVESKEVKEIYELFKNVTSLEEFHSMYIKLSILDSYRN